MAKRPWTPMMLSAAGVLGLLGSWACFPPIPLTGTYGPPPVAAPVPARTSPPPSADATSPPPATPSATPSAPPGSPAPTTSVPGATPAAPAASAAPYGDLAPVVGRSYVYRTTGAGAGQLLVAVTAIDGAQASYRSQELPAAGSPPPARDGRATRTNGVYWVFPDQPNPVTAALESYPLETVTTPAGTGLASKVAAGSETWWFVSGVIVKAVTAAGTTELEKVQ